MRGRSIDETSGRNAQRSSHHLHVDQLIEAAVIVLDRYLFNSIELAMNEATLSLSANVSTAVVIALTNPRIGSRTGL